MPRNDKYFWELLETGRGKEGFFPRVSRGNLILPNLDFRLLGSRPVRKYISIVLNYPVCSNLLLLP
jgi:hypothetical protein